MIKTSRQLKDFIKNKAKETNIKNDSNFKEKINNILKENKKVTSFKNKESDSLNFKDTDLYFAINNSYIKVIGNKNIDNKWDLEVILNDKYDYTKFKTAKDYYNGGLQRGILSSTVYNAARVSVKLGVIKEYSTTIKFNIYDCEA